ncbi:SMI1/KNR4 family protein [Pseudomonas aeruginosa]|uniref:SMI1/KNR4 family protein n=1 Tax=Pseudomonas aeruginosa TaxID=287 RepID=UPI000A634091|nr:SMI1/KNR4 family protein [Pseudomonas aeruginosa]EIU7165478.1 SMI1/KNR4 family protein [Pseudomonas aeruginosa]HEK2504955.1 SMI1/KNR4 family protein [Pseudomonas aeruginosa]
MKPELDALEAWLGRPLPAAFVVALEQHGGCLVEPGLLLYAADELLERTGPSKPLSTAPATWP